MLTGVNYHGIWSFEAMLIGVNMVSGALTQC